MPGDQRQLARRREVPGSPPRAARRWWKARSGPVVQAAPGGLHDQPAGLAGTLLVDPPPWRAGSEPDWRTRGSSPRWRGVGKRRTSPTAAMNAVAVTALTPGKVISRLISEEPSAWRATSRPTSGSPRRESRSGAGTRRPSPARRRAENDLLGEPPAALRHEQVGHRRAGSQVALQDRVNLVLLARSAADEPTPPGDQAPLHARPLVRRPHIRQEAAASRFAAVVGVDLVGFRAQPSRGLDCLRVGQDTCATCGSINRAIASAFAVASRTTSSCTPGSRRTASAWPARSRPTGTPHLPLLGDRGLAEVAMHVQPDLSHLSLLSDFQQRSVRRQRRLRIGAGSTPEQSQGRPTTNLRALGP